MANKSKQPFASLRCPHCGEIGELRVLVETMALECGACSEGVTKAEIEQMVSRWANLFAWLASAAEYAAP